MAKLSDTNLANRMLLSDTVIFCVYNSLNLLKPTGYVMSHQFNITTSVRSAHTVFMCFVFI